MATRKKRASAADRLKHEAKGYVLFVLIFGGVLAFIAFSSYALNHPGGGKQYVAQWCESE